MKTRLLVVVCKARPHYFLILLMVSVFCAAPQAQITSVVTQNSFRTRVTQVETVGNQMYCFAGSGWGSLWRIDLTNETIDTVNASVDEQASVKSSSSGIFYATYSFNSNVREYSLHFQDTLGNEMNPVRYHDRETGNGNHYRPKFATMVNDRYYVQGYFNNEHCIWESDGTNAGTQVVFASSNEIICMDNRNDTIVFIERNGANHNFYHYTAGGSPVLYASETIASLSEYFLFSGRSDNYLYFAGRDSSGTSNIYQLDFINPPSVFISNSSGFLDFNGTDFTLNFNWKFLVRGTEVDPTQLDTVRFKKEIIRTPSINGQSALISEDLGGGFYRMKSIEQGYEIAVVNENDSLVLIETNIYGPGSGISYNLKNNFVGYEPPSISFLSKDSVLYSVLTNGNDPYHYIYRLSASGETSICRLDNPEVITKLIGHGGFVYWFEREEEGFQLKRHSLTPASSNQPLEKTKSDMWYRQLGIGYGNNVDQVQNMSLYLQNVEVDRDGNAIIAYNSDKYATSVTQVFSDTNVVRQAKATQLLAKYAPNGDLLWQNGIGSLSGLFYSNNEIVVRPEGNVIVAGQFFQKAYFDEDSIEVPRAGLFLAELDGATGDVIRYRLLAEKNYANDFKIERLVLDEFGNIYVAFYYKNFGIEFAGAYISDVASPNNALAKLTPEGDLIWVKNTRTPWTDKFGETRVLDYSEEFHTLTLVQSQGAHNWWSSCEYSKWGNYIQEFDTSGTLTSTYEFIGSDLGGVGVGVRTSENSFFSLGFFRGTLELDHFTLNTAPSSSCNKNEMFGVVYDNSLQTIVSAGMSDDFAFFPIDMSITNDFLYVLGVDEEDSIHILRFTRDGNYVGYKSLNQKSYFFSSNLNDYIAVHDDVIYIAGVNYRTDIETDVVPFVNGVHSFSLLKMKNDDWKSGGPWFEMSGTDLPAEIDDAVLIYPNPFEDHIQVVFENIDENYSKYTVVDQIGRIVQSGDLNGMLIQKIFLSPMSSGLYTIVFSGENVTTSESILKL